VTTGTPEAEPDVRQTQAAGPAPEPTMMAAHRAGSRRGEHRSTCELAGCAMHERTVAAADVSGPGRSGASGGRQPTMVGWHRCPGCNRWALQPAATGPAGLLPPGGPPLTDSSRTTSAARPAGQAGWEPGWELSAACRLSDPDLFFPISHAGASLTQVRAAKAICAACPVRPQCLAFAQRTRQRHGIWGGLTEQERNAAAMEQHRGTQAAEQQRRLG
jgi:WhiB family transcriptional regulator, redox-sensing transcriptional regulator